VQNGIVFANWHEAAAEYTVTVSFDEWPDMAAEALAVRLASDAAVALRGDPASSAALYQKYQLMAQQARQNSMNEERRPAPLATQYIDARWA
jgi:hypothetical protein